MSTDWHSQVYQLLPMSECKLLRRSENDQQTRNLRLRSNGDQTPKNSPQFLVIEVPVIAIGGSLRFSQPLNPLWDLPSSSKDAHRKLPSGFCKFLHSIFLLLLLENSKVWGVQFWRSFRLSSLFSLRFSLFPASAIAPPFKKYNSWGVNFWFITYLLCSSLCFKQLDLESPNCVCVMEGSAVSYKESGRS